ncbi:hypothetical protein JVT61DRAFT_12534 [Boletus reticuloceps]|uniref:Uncharacterized protein n=1 Tax=Boletus reticuloceps TaxID=495285 RepID=A0A8I2YDQ6_9AGAM|nr:hypothetical protein JVT61DRAFT_12534 [Boletus reticuloceps]
MVQSGELAKYPLAIIDRLLTVYGPDGGLAYDIGCAFATTLANSVLGPRARVLNLHLMVGAFHGHAHNRQCQLKWHLMYIPGTGHTEGKGCEHVFSASNVLARGTFLRNHYREALKAVQTLEAELLVIKNELNLTDDDFRQFHEAEKRYFAELKEPPHEEYLKIRYVEMLNELAECQNEWNLARTTANNIRSRVANDQIFLTIFHTHKRIDTAYAKLQNAETQTLHIEKRWDVGSDQYTRYKQEASMGKYRTALNELERLVVSRLFELSKMSLSGTGYKLRRQVSKALQCRSAAIRTAITRYNTQAQALNPPRPKLSWKDITDYSFLGEFDLLWYSREDVRSNDWTKPAYREATTKFFRLQRAREEILRLNIEIWRLYTAIHDEETAVLTAIRNLTDSDPHLASEIQHWWQERTALNAVHLHHLAQIQGLPGFSGKLELGVCDVEECPPMDTAGDLPVSAVDGMNNHACEVERIISSEYHNTDLLKQMEDDELLELFTQYIECIGD